MKTPRFQTRRGFTLIELLTVIAIIGILAAIIIPTVGKVRDTARTGRCASNLRQLATAAMLYEQERRFYPPTRANADFSANRATDDASQSFFVQSLAPYMSTARDNTSGDVRECPSYRTREQEERGSATPQADSAYYYRAGYAPNRRPLLASNVDTDLSLLNANKISNPSRTILLMEAKDWHANGYNESRTGYNRSVPANWIGDRHGAKSNYAYFDGSVRSLDPFDGLALIMRPGTTPTR